MTSIFVTIWITVQIQESVPDHDSDPTNGFWWNITGVWPRDQLITFWWRSASLSGSGTLFGITIRIREELPQFCYAGIRRRSVLSEYFYCFHFSLSVCTSVNWKSYEQILTKFIGGVGHGPGTKWLNFGDDPDHRPDPEVQNPDSLDYVKST